MTLSGREIHKKDIVGVVCHDAGGAEVVSEWLLQSGLDFCCCLAGPALDIFRRKFEVINNTSLDLLVNQSDWLLCGSSWQSDLEKQAIKYSIKSQKYAVVCLDHWVNYEDRFIADGALTLPNELWVCDNYAYEIATELFPGVAIKIIDNPYLQKIKLDLATAFSDENDTDIDILYVCEPIREHAKIKYGDEYFLGYTEESALNFFFENIGLLPFNVSRVIVRPHPSDPSGKYDWVLNYKTDLLDITIGGGSSLISEIIRSKCIVGCESMAMVVGILAGKIIYSSIPNEGRSCELPHKEILTLASIVSKKEAKYD